MEIDSYFKICWVLHQLTQQTEKRSSKRKKKKAKKEMGRKNTLERSLSLDDVRLAASDMLTAAPLPEALWDARLELVDDVLRRLLLLPFPFKEVLLV